MRLLNSDWFVTKKNKIFLLACVAVFLIAAWSAVGQAKLRTDYASMNCAAAEEGIKPPFEEVAINMIPALGVAFAFVAAAVINDGFETGAMREKVVGGFSRRAIYFGAFLNTFCACSVLTLLALLGDFAAAPLVNWEESAINVWSYALTAGLLFLNTASWCSMFTLVGMLVCGRGTLSGLMCLIAACTVYIALAAAFINIQEMLSEPEIILEYAYDPLTGVETQVGSMPNPYYLSAGQRAFWTGMLEALPMSQSMFLMGFSPEHPLAMALYSLGITAVCGAVGSAAFARRDLK